MEDNFIYYGYAQMLTKTPIMLDILMCVGWCVPWPLSKRAISVRLRAVQFGYKIARFPMYGSL